MQDVLALILGGGRGTRLHPLTRERSKPAVPLAGKYRLIDIPISNCLNSGVNRIFVLTQFLAESLNHHIGSAYRLDGFRREGFVNLLPAEQTESKGNDWYQGTADAVRKTLRHTGRYRFEQFLVLSGDHIYRMDYRKMVNEHRSRRAAVTVAALEVDRSKVSELGVMNVDNSGQIRRFVEKPSDSQVIDSLEIGADYFVRRGESVQSGMYLANMGVYVFDRDVMIELLEETDASDFGREILPRAIERGLGVYAHRFNGYWEDIGTIRAFFDANLAFADNEPRFSFFDESNRIFTRRRFLPPNRIIGATMNQVFLPEGCVIENATLEHVVVGIRSRIGGGCSIRDSVLMGADYYETDTERVKNASLGRPDTGIGKNCTIIRTIVDKNARIGDGVKLVGGDKPDCSGDGWTLRDGVLVVHKNATIQSGTIADFG